MKLRNIVIISFIIVLTSCNGEGKKQNTTQVSFCNDTTCITEPLHYESQADGKPFVTITFANCKIDSIHWEKKGMKVVRDIVFNDFIPKDVKPSKSLISCDIMGSKYAWIKLNDCKTGRGYLIKLPFDKDGTATTSAINNFDPEFKVADGLVAYYDNTFIYVQDMETDLIAKTLLTDTGVKEIDYDDVHSLIKNVNITRDHITAAITVDGKTINIDKPLVFK